jgi:hypothetical protein
MFLVSSLSIKAITLPYFWVTFVRIGFYSVMYIHIKLLNLHTL